MSNPQQRFTGREYTFTVAWLAVAIVFIPAAVITVRPSVVTLLLATAGSAVCLAGAWLTWKKSSRLSIPTIANGPDWPSDNLPHDTLPERIADHAEHDERRDRSNELSR